MYRLALELTTDNPDQAILDQSQILSNEDMAAYYLDYCKTVLPQVPSLDQVTMGDYDSRAKALIENLFQLYRYLVMNSDDLPVSGQTLSEMNL